MNDRRDLSRFISLASSSESETNHHFPSAESYSYRYKENITESDTSKRERFLQSDPKLSHLYKTYESAYEDSDEEIDDHDSNEDDEYNLENGINKPMPIPIQAGKDWNAEFQVLLEQQTTSEKHLTERYKKLAELARDFCYAAQVYGKIIIGELGLPVPQKTIKPVTVGGRAGGDKYIVLNILFKFALDTEGIYGNNDEAAMKAAGHELLGLMSYYNCQIPGLNDTNPRNRSLPLMALINYRGFRLVALSLLPIDKTTLIYGSSDGGQHVRATNPKFNGLMEQAAGILNLKAHLVGMNSKAILHAAGDIEGHYGKDKRFYLVDFARVFPPQLKMRRDRKPRHLYELLRPELVKSNPKPLSSDALTGWGTHDPENCKIHNTEVKEATLQLYFDVIPKFAERLSKLTYNEMENIRLIEECHREGINIRHLGFVRASVSNPEVRQMILMICITRVLKNKLNARLRDKLRKIKVPSEEPYRKVILAFLNKVLDYEGEWWTVTVKRYLKEKFVECLSPEEEDELFDLRKCVDVVQIFENLSALTGIQFSQSAMEEFRREPNSFRFVDPDVLAIEATVKYMNLIEHSSAVVLYYEASRNLGRESSRLFALADTKFSQALARAPNSAMTLFHWGRMLHVMAVRAWRPGLAYQRQRIADISSSSLSLTRSSDFDSEMSEEEVVEEDERDYLSDDSSQHSVTQDGKSYGATIIEGLVPVNLSVDLSTDDSDVYRSELTSVESYMSPMKSRLNFSLDTPISNNTNKVAKVPKSRNSGPPTPMTSSPAESHSVHTNFLISPNSRSASVRFPVIRSEISTRSLSPGDQRPRYRSMEIPGMPKLPVTLQPLAASLEVTSSKGSMLDRDHFSTTGMLSNRSAEIRYKPKIKPVSSESMVTDAPKAEELFISSEEKFARALKINSNFPEARTNLVEMLVDYAEFLFDKVKLKPHHFANEILKLSKAKFVQALQLDVNLFDTLLNKARAIEEMYNQASDFKAKRESFEMASTIYSALRKLNKLHPEVNMHYGGLMFRFYVDSMKKQYFVENAQTYSAKAARRLGTTFAVYKDNLSNIYRRIFDSYISDINTLTKPNAKRSRMVKVCHELLALLEFSSYFPDMQNDFKLKLEQVTRLNFKGLSPEVFNEDKLIELLAFCPNLTFLVLDECRITDKTMTHIAKYCHKLEYLSCVGCRSITMGPVLRKGKKPRIGMNSRKAESVMKLDPVEEVDDSISRVSTNPNNQQWDLNGESAPLPAELKKLKRQQSRVTSQQRLSFSKEKQLNSSLVKYIDHQNREMPLTSEFYYFPEGLTHLDLSMCALITSDAVGCLAVFSQIERLYLSYVNRTMDEALVAVLRSCLKLRVLDLTECYQLTSTSLLSLPQQTALQELYLRKCRNVSDDCLQMVIKSCHMLTHLDLSFIPSVTNTTVKMIADRCSSMRILKLRNCEMITDMGLKALAKKLPLSLLELDLSGCTQITDQSIVVITRNCSRLKVLSLSGLFKLTSVSLNEIAKHSAVLQSLDLSQCLSLEGGLQHILANCPALEKLYLDGCLLIGANAKDFFNIVVSKAKELLYKNSSPDDFCRIKVLHFNSGNLTNESLAAIVKACPMLEELQIKECTKVTDGGLQHIAKLKNLVRLHLDGCKISDLGVNYLAQSESKQSLRLLSIQGCDEVTDRSLTFLSKYCKRLSQLFVADCDVSDEGLLNLLESCNEIEELYVKNGSKVTTKLVLEIKARFPRVRALIMTANTIF